MKNGNSYEAERWFNQAKEDFKTVEILIENGRYYMACFLSQQTGEKAIKAYLYAQGEAAVFGHSISKLCERAGQYKKAFLELKSTVKNLDQFYIEARYPNGLPDDIPATFFNKADSEQAKEMAKKIIVFVEENL